MRREVHPTDVSPLELIPALIISAGCCSATLEDQNIDDTTTGNQKELSVVVNFL